MQLSDTTTRVIVLMAAAPGINAYLFAAMYNRGQDSSTASSVLLSTLLSMFTISGWLILM